jgi:hypothetical protein
MCGTSYYRDHHRKVEVYGDGFFDCIHGVCPQDHERTFAD